MKINVTYRRALYAAAVLGILEDIEIIANHVGALARVWVLVLSGINIQGRREEKFLRGPLKSALRRYIGIYAITVTDTATNQTTWAVWKLEKTFLGKKRPRNGGPCSRI